MRMSHGSQHCDSMLRMSHGSQHVSRHESQHISRELEPITL